VLLTNDVKDEVEISFLHLDGWKYILSILTSKIKLFNDDGIKSTFIYVIIFCEILHNVS
jgi:hypothetical protein